MIELYANTVANGVLMGLVYALLAIGLTIIFGVMRIVNFAHGEMVIAGMYIGYVAWQTFNLAPLEGAGAAALLTFLVGYLLQRFLVDRFIDRPQHIQFLLFIAFAFILTGMHVLIFGAEPRSILSPLTFETYRFGIVRVDAVRVQAAAGAVAMIAVLFLLIRFSPLGRRIRAAADNPLGARVVGIRISRVYAATAGIGMACAGAAGALVAPLFSIHPYLAPEFTLLAFVIVIIGGLGSVVGALAGGVLIGAAEALAAVTFTPSLKSMFSYALLILVLLIRPSGLFGVREEGG